MIFKDPIRTIQAEISAGWAYDPFNSTLTDFVFSRWDQPQEMIAFHVRRATIPSSQSDEEWIQKIRVETKGNAVLTDMPSAHGRAVAAEFKSNRGWVQRVAFVRGPHVELVIEQRSAMQAAQNIWEPLEKAVMTAESSANLELPEDSGPEGFNKSVQEVNRAFEKDDRDAIENALRKSIDSGTSVWLHSMAMPDRPLEINAAVRVAQAMMHLGKLTAEQSLVRDAEFLLRRSQHSLEAAELETDWARELSSQTSETLRHIWSELLEPSEPESSDNMLPILSLRERGFRSADAAAKAFEARDLENALKAAGAAIDDILSLIAFLRQNRAQEIPEEILAHLLEHGITDKEQQKDAIQKARETLLFPPLNVAVQIRHCCALELRDNQEAKESVAVRTPLAQLIFDSNPEDAGTALNLALAMMDCAGAAALSTNSGALDEASRCLDEASQILGAIDGKKAGNDFWIHFHKNQIEAALKAFDQSLAVAEEEKMPLVVQNLVALRSRFQAIAVNFGDSHHNLEIAGK